MWTEKERSCRTDGIKETNICFFASFAKVLDNIDATKLLYTINGNVELKAISKIYAVLDSASFVSDGEIS